MLSGPGDTLDGGGGVPTSAQGKRELVVDFTSVRGVPTVDPSSPVIIIYGRRRISPKAIESGQANWGTTDQKVIFYLLSEGEIGGVQRWYLDGEETEDEVGTIKTLGIFYRGGSIGVDDDETVAEYDASPTTQKRAQNRDFRSVTGQTYSETAYAIFLAKVDNEIETLPRVAFDVKGVKLQKYLSTGAADGSPVWSENPVWQLVDLMLSSKHGLGLATADLDFAPIKSAADYCDISITATEASTTVTTAQSTATTVCDVGSVEGFVVGRTITVAGAANTVAGIPSDTRLTLGTAVVQSVSDAVVQTPPRFGSNLVLKDPGGNADTAIKNILMAFRGYITYSSGKVQIHAEQSQASTGLHFRDSGAAAGFGIVDGSFRWETDRKDRTVNRMAVRITNDGADAGTDEVVVNDLTHQKSHRLVTKSITAPAIADRDQAHRIASFLLAKIRTLGPGASFRAGTGAVRVQPGDIIEVTHTVPDWTAKEVRVVKKSIIGLGDNDELLVDLTVEDYDATIYSDTGPGAREVPTRPSPTLALAIDDASGKRLIATATLSGSTLTPIEYRLHRSSTSGFTPSSATLVARGPSSILRYMPTHAEVGSVLYFVAQAVTDRATIQSSQVAQFVSFVAKGDLDPTVAQAMQRTNLVYDGDFTTASNWTLSTAGASNVYPDSWSGVYANPANAADDDADASTMALTAGDVNKEETWSFSGYTGGSSSRSGTLKVEHRKSHATDVDQTIKYSTNGGSSWSTLATSTTTTTLSTHALSGIDITQLRVKATSSADPIGSGGTVYVSRIYFEDNGGTAAISSGQLTLAGNLSGGKATAKRVFPVQSTATRRHLAAGSSISVSISAKGASADAPLQVWLRETGGTWEQKILEIPAASLASSYYEFGQAAVAVDASIPAAALEVWVETASTVQIKCDKLMIVRGDYLLAFDTHPSEQSGTSGTIGDYGTGATTGGGDWDPGLDDLKSSNDPVE